MKQLTVIILVISIFFSIPLSANAQTPRNNSIIITAARLSWIAGAGAEYQYRYKNLGIGADLLFGRNAGDIRGVSSHIIVKGHLPIIEGLSTFVSLGIGGTYTWDSLYMKKFKFNPYIAAGFEGRMNWFIGSLEVGYGPYFDTTTYHSTYVKFGVGMTF